MEQSAAFELRRLGPVATGRALGIFFACASMLSGLSIFVFGLFEGYASVDAPSFTNLRSNLYGLVLITPLMTAVMGFVTGIVFGCAYNWAARRFGGIPVVLTRDAEPSRSNA
jgi:hypothetical protein